MLDFTMDGEVQKHRKQLVAKAVANRAVGTTEYRDMTRRFNDFLKRYDEIKQQMSFYRQRCYDLEGELRVVQPELYQAYQKIDRQQQRLDQLAAENVALDKSGSMPWLQRRCCGCSIACRIG